jgi:hypothetical protein
VTGLKFGRLTVVKSYLKQRGKQNETYCFCECECGGTKETRAYLLKIGQCKSCGCLAFETAKKQAEKMGKRNKRHGKSGTRIYRIWRGMKSRCDIPKESEFHNYKGKGIIYDPRWSKFEEFYKDMNEGYSDELTLERIDVNGNYCKENCKWATCQEQSMNKSNSLYFELNGETKHIFEWSKLKGIHLSTIKTRLRTGWSVERALTTPAANNGRKR